MKYTKGKPKGMSETEYLMGNPVNAAYLLEALEEIDKLVEERRLSKENNCAAICPR